MICKNCGTENKPASKFCKKCGAMLKTQLKRKLVISGSIVLVIIVCFVSFTVYADAQKGVQYKEKLQTGNKYSEKLDYPKAETTYLEAIKIEPKSEEAYIELSDIYTKQGKYDKAISTLKTGQKRTGSSNFEIKISEVQKEKKRSSKKAQYRAYDQLCAEYQERYGAGKCNNSRENDDALLANTEMLEGLCVAQLIDFNKDGNEELLLGYGKLSDDGVSTLMQYYYEIWAWNDERTIQILESTGASHGQDVTCWIETASSQEGIFLVQDYAGDEVCYLEYTGKKLTTKYKIEGGENQAYSDQRINGKKATLNEIKDLESKLARPLSRAYSKVTFKESYINEDNKTLFIPLNYIASVTAGEVLETTHKTLERLKNK